MRNQYDIPGKLIMIVLYTLYIFKAMILCSNAA